MPFRGLGKCYSTEDRNFARPCVTKRWPSYEISCHQFTISIHLYFSNSVCLRQKRNIMIASSLQGLLICYGESLSGTLRPIECQKMSEVQKEKESISRYLSFKPMPPMTVSPHALETTNSGNSMEFYGDPVLPWAEGLFQGSIPKRKLPLRRFAEWSHSSGTHTSPWWRA